MATLRWFGWGMMAFLVAAFVAWHAPKYFTLKPSRFFELRRAVYVAHLPGIMIHIAASMLALIVGPLQFLPWLRKRHLTTHRWLGRTYVASVLVGSVAGFYMAWLSYGGLPTHLAFASLAVWWCATALVAYRHIIARRIEAHRRWMIRSYAMTFAAVTLRFWLLLFIFPLRIPFEEAYATVAWICWVWNIPVAEWLIRRRAIAPQRAARPAATQPGLAPA